MSSLDNEKLRLLEFIILIEQHVSFMKHYFFRIGERNMLVCAKFEKLATKGFPKDSAQCYQIHPVLPDVIPRMNTAIQEMTKELRTLSSRTGTVCAQDLLTFLEGWKVVKALAKKLVKTNTKKIMDNKTRLFPKADEESRTKIEDDVMFQTKKEIESLEEKVLFQLKDLHGCLIDFCHAQLYYHAKGLEHWSEVWNSLKKMSDKDPSKMDVLATIKSTFQQRTASEYKNTKMVSKKTLSILENDDEDLDDELGELEKEMKKTKFFDEKDNTK